MIEMGEELLRFTSLASLTNRIPSGKVRCDPISEDGILIQVPTYKDSKPFCTELYVTSTSLNKIQGLMQIAMDSAVQHAEMALKTEAQSYKPCDLKKCYTHYMYSCTPSMMLIAHVWPDVAQAAWDATVRNHSQVFY